MSFNPDKSCTLINSLQKDRLVTLLPIHLLSWQSSWGSSVTQYPRSHYQPWSFLGKPHFKVGLQSQLLILHPLSYKVLPCHTWTPIHPPFFSTCSEHKYKAWTQIYPERHSIERIPPPGWKVDVLYCTEKPDLDLDLNDNQIGLCLSPSHNASTTFWNIVLSIGFGPISQWWRESLEKFSYPDADLHQNQINLSSSYSQADDEVSSESVYIFLRYSAHWQTDKLGWKHNLRSPSVVEVNGKYKSWTLSSTYSGENKYLIHCRFCRFSHLQST